MKKLHVLTTYLFINVLFLVIPNAVGYIDIEWRLPVQQIIVIPVTAIVILLPYAMKDFKKTFEIKKILT